MGLTEAEGIKERWQEYTEELYKKDLHDPDNHDNVNTNIGPDILVYHFFFFSTESDFISVTNLKYLIFSISLIFTLIFTISFILIALLCCA